MKMYGNGNIGYSIREINGGNFVVAGSTDFYYNYHWFQMSSIASTNIHLFQTDWNGNVMWEKIYSSNTSRTIARWMEPTPDGGFVITGSKNSDVTWPPDSNDVIVIKTDAAGAISWSKYYDTGKDELAFCVRQTSDGGFIVSGFHDAVPVSTIGNTYVLLLKIDQNGNALWVKKYQFAVRDLATGEPMIYVVRQTANNGFIIVGTTAGSHAADVYIIRTDDTGNPVWANSYEHDVTALRFSLGLDVIESSNGDFIIAGSMDKDHLAIQYNYPYILKVSSAGVLKDARFFETNPLLMWQSGFSSVVQTADGGFFFTGMGGYSIFGDQSQLLKTDVNFDMQWSRVYTVDGNATMGTRSGIQTADGGYAFTGKKQFDGTVILKTNSEGLVSCKNPSVLQQIIPGLIVQSRIPASFAGINVFNFPLSTLSPLNDTLIPCNVITLPVEINKFSAQLFSEKSVDVFWATASEINNDYFVVERSLDGVHFEESGRVKGAGNSTGQLEYAFRDNIPAPADLIYYRLKQVDFNGQFTYSKSIPIAIKSNSFEFISAGFNAMNQLEIKYFNPDMKPVSCRVFDVFGKVLFEKTQAAQSPNDRLISAGSFFGNGVYFVTLQCGNTTITRMLLKL